MAYALIIEEYWQLVLNAHNMAYSSVQDGAEPSCSPTFITPAWEVQYPLLELLNKINGKVMQLLAKPVTLTAEDSSAWRSGSHTWERI